MKHGADLSEEAARGFLSKVLGSPLEEFGAPEPVNRPLRVG
jgi:hypothetical protein